MGQNQHKTQATGITVVKRTGAGNRWRERIGINSALAGSNLKFNFLSYSFFKF